jgi:D-sedoheptulose 7-phosphate isomerase
MSAEIDRAVELCTKAKHDKRRFFFIGNGGSAAIASHMAADWLKNGNVAAMCFNDPALLTCIANDLGYENVFAKPLSLHGGQGDVLFAISSSGQSKSITRAAYVASGLRMKIITLSGFRPDNPLRKMGELNFYVPSDRYGEVEIAHHTICHGILDRCITS